MISTEQAKELLSAGFPGWGTFTLNPIPGGLTNLNLLIETGRGEKFVARLPGKDTDLFGINRQTEHAISRVAWEIGIAPEPLAFLAEHEILVTRFVEGGPIETTDPATIRSVARLLHRLHSAPEVPGTFDLPSVIDDYITTAKRFNVTHPGQLGEALEFSAEIVNAIGRCPRVSAPCHNDLIAANFLQGKDRLYLLDWEYAGMGDPYVDLGNCAVNFCMDEAGCRTLMESYLGREPSPSEMAQLHLLRVLSDLREAMWSYVQVGISTLDVDFHAYGMKHLERFLDNAKSDSLNTWLGAVGA
ncbi:MAG: phosphotransferase family protein [Verrucomicrobia bacterium]|nr:phosphotransferase family protein [Verrucomicrobiota bacterium]MBT6103746.1 phosphotransferase family protein [Verrucomicrobiota bacterium]